MYSHLLSRTLIGLDCIFLIVGFMIVSSCHKLIYFNALGRGSPPPEFLKKSIKRVLILYPMQRKEVDVDGFLLCFSHGIGCIGSFLVFPMINSYHPKG
jgi:hypothetical protein